MFTFCFTPIAVRQMRKTSARPTYVHSARRGLAIVAALAVAFAATNANAGGPKGMSMSGAGRSVGSMSSLGSNSFHPQITNSNQLNANKFVLNNTTALNGSSLKLNTQPSGLNRVLNNNDKIKLDTPAKLNLSQGVKDKIAGNTKGINKIVSLDKKDKHDCHKDCCDPCCHYHCCPWWFCWDYPTWCPLYGRCCGYWEAPIVEVPVGLDLQLLGVRMVDSGDPEANLGPTFRVWFRNNSSVAINHPFNVLALVAADAKPVDGLPQAGVRIPAIEAGQTLAADIRLPAEANRPGLPMLHVLVDSHREIGEVDKTNNGAVMPRAEILPLDSQPEQISMTSRPVGPMQTTAPFTGIEKPVTPIDPIADAPVNTTTAIETEDN
jgi:hypothetical protein